MDVIEGYFLLKEPKSNKATLINYFLTCPDGLVKRSIQRKIHPDDWDPVKKRPREPQPGKKKDQKLQDLANFLYQFEQMEKDTKSDCRRNKTIISKAMVDAAIDIILQDTAPQKAGHDRKEEARDMFKDFRSIIAETRAGTITYGKQKKKYKESTIIQLESAINMVEQFFKKKSLPALYDKVTVKTYEDFISWGQEDNHSTNYIGSLIKRWKTLAKIARKKGWHTNMVFESDEFVKIEEDTDDIFLAEEKIQAIANTTVGLPIYDIARDWFVLDCYLGLRVSDLLGLTEKDFEGGMFQLVNQKTGAKVAIPLNPAVQRIIKKYKGLPPSISDAKLNFHIKEVARRAKLDETFIYTITKGGVLQTIRCKEWEMVSSHTCRRTFITNLLRMGVPHFQVMKLAGIKSYNTLKKYFKQSAVEVAEEMKSHPFFTGK